MSGEEKEEINKLRELEKKDETRVEVTKTWSIDWEGFFKKLFRR